MKTLRSQIILVSVLLLCAVTVYAWFSIKSSYDTQKLLSEYEIRNRITGYLNAAAGWQAIERDYGATIIGSGKGDSSPLFPKYIEAGEKGDSIVLEIDKNKKELLSVNKDNLFEDKLYRWLEAYGDLQDNRPRIAYRNISEHEWFEVATHNINAEFDLRDITFTPQNKEEKILYFNDSIRPNIAKLSEYAGRERAFIGNAIASRKPFPEKTLGRIQHYRSIVEESLDQVLILKEFSATSSRMKQAIEAFDKEFIQSFQLLREEVFASSKKMEEERNVAEMQMAKRKEMFKFYLAGIQKDLLSMGGHKSVVSLAKALIAGGDMHLSERLSAVESLFETFSNIKKFYAQIRLLDSFGHELVRVDFDGNNTKIISGTQLQDKSNRYYFKGSINLLPGEVYTSPVDLNIENGEIEYPYKPVMRIATPIFAYGREAGIVVFNLPANAVLLHIDTEENGEDEYILANRDGFYSHHPDKVKEWGMVELLNRSHHNIGEDYPGLAEQILSGKEGSALLASGAMILYKPFFLNFESDTGNFWVIIKEIAGVEYPVDASTWFDRATTAINTGLAISNIAGDEANTILLEMKATAKRDMLIMFIIFVFATTAFIFFVLWTRNRILNPIHKLTEITQNITKGDLSLSVEVKSRDEIGILATNFNKMTKRLTSEIYERSVAEKNVKKEKQYTEELLDNAQDAIISIDENGIVNVWNKSAENVFGYLKSEIIGKHITTIIPERYRKQHNDGLERFLKTREARIIGKTVKIYGMTKKGVEIPIEMSLSFQEDGEGRCSFMAIIRDISEKQKWENEIRKLSSAIEQSPVSVVITDMKGNIEYVNKKFMQATGYTYEEVVGQNPRVLKSGEKTPEEYKELWETITSGNEWRGEFHNKKKNGQLYWEYASISPIRNEEGDITNFLAVKEDISERKEMEDMLHDSNKKLELLFSTIPSIIIELTEDFKVVRWNVAAESCFGIAASDIIGKSFRECDIQWDWDKVIEKTTLCQKTNLPTSLDDFKYKKDDGSYGFLGITITPIKSEVDKQSGLLLLMKDITERKNTEQQLAHSQKLEAIGELAAGIAHEINTPTQFISDNVFFFQDAFSKISTLLKKYSHLTEMNKAGSVTPELIKELDVMAEDIELGYLVEEIPVAIEETQNGIKRVTEIVQSMKTFSHPDNEEKTLIDINKMIESTITVARNEWKYVADMDTDFDSDLPLVPCYPGEFNQVILNLIINAVHAIGEVSGNGDAGNGKISVCTHCDGDWAEIRIGDTGAGIPEEIRPRIFEQFFTTKEVGKGTGQGLAIAHSVVVNKHNGEITFDTEVGKGTTFIIRLPINLPPLKEEQSHEEANTIC